MIVMLMAARSCKAQQLCIIMTLCLGAHSVMVQLAELVQCDAGGGTIDDEEQQWAAFTQHPSCQAGQH